MIADIVGGAIAFLCAVGVTYLDCYQVLRKTTWRIPDAFWTSWKIRFLSFGCGALAAGAFALSLTDNAFLTNVLGAAIPNHLARGLYTGVAVLALIRSKLFQVKDTDFGFEYIYAECRSICLREVNIAWTASRNRFAEHNLRSFLDRLSTNPSFDDQIIDLVRAAIKDADDKTKGVVDAQLTSVVSQKSDPDRSSYGRALLGLALENCGRKPVLSLLEAPPASR